MHIFGIVFTLNTFYDIIEVGGKKYFCEKSIIYNDASEINPIDLYPIEEIPSDSVTRWFQYW